MPRGPKSVVEILAGGKKVQAEVAKACAKPKAGATMSAKSAKYLCPILNPGEILCIGLNYRKHAEETGGPIRLPGRVLPLRQHAGAAQRQMPLPSHPHPARLGGRAHHRDRQEVPQRCQGEGARRDRRLRLLQRRLAARLAVKGSQWTLGKNFDGTGGFGPDIVTSDELPPGGAPLRIMTRVNGEVMQDNNTDDLIFDVPTLVHEISKV